MNCIVIVCDTLRRDHCGPYHQGRPVNEISGPAQPGWVVPTPNIDRLAQRGTTFDSAWCGSTPCAPARRDIYTGRYEFLERGWGPLEESDSDLPRQVSGPPNTSITRLERRDDSVSQLISDHFHLWEQGMGNYHMGYTGFEFIRGAESDAWKTEPVSFSCPDDRNSKTERHFRNVYLTRETEEDYFAARVFRQASEWLNANQDRDDFYLHIDCFDPHEPWDPPEELLKQFDSRGYDLEDWHASPEYDEWETHYSEEEFRHIQAVYAAEVTLVDRWLGHLLDTMDELGLWDDTMVILTTDHGTHNGDRGRLGKLQTHQHDELAHIPFIVAHPKYGQGERRDQLVQLVDIYPTVLEAVGQPCPPVRHGKPIQRILRDEDTTLRDYAISGMFGESITITDGEWILHQAPEQGNEPLYWYGYHDAMFFDYDLGPVENGRRSIDLPYSFGTSTWLSDKRADPLERENLIDREPQKVQELQTALVEVMEEIDAPTEQRERLGI